MRSYFFVKLGFCVRQFYMAGMQILKSLLLIKCSTDGEEIEMANLYVEVKITWVFQTSPASYLFYADSKCDAFNMGRFSDSFTVYTMVEAIGNESVTMSKLKRDLFERYRDRMAVVETRRITRSQYVEAIERLREECAA